MIRLRYRGGLCNIVGIDYEGEGKRRAGGLACLWDDSIQVDVVSMFANNIDMRIRIRDIGQV